MGWQDSIERTVGGLGYELVDVERAPRGLLRVTIDRVPGRAYPTGESEFITVDDCEVVTRQLQYVLEVEQLAYERLEVSSPGLDRPLKKPADYARFAGEQIELTLKLAFQGRKRYTGRLEALPSAAEADPSQPATAWRLVLADPAAADGKPGERAFKASKARAAAKAAKAVKAAAGAEPTSSETATVPAVEAEVDRVLDFTVDEVREAHLVPVINFKGRSAQPAAGPGAADAAPTTNK